MLGNQRAADRQRFFVVFGLFRHAFAGIRGRDLIADPIVGGRELAADRRRLRICPGDAFGHLGRLLEFGAGQGGPAQGVVDVAETDQRLDRAIIDSALAVAARVGGGDLAQALPGDLQQRSPQLKGAGSRGELILDALDQRAEGIDRQAALSVCARALASATERSR